MLSGVFRGVSRVLLGALWVVPGGFQGVARRSLGCCVLGSFQGVARHFLGWCVLGSFQGVARHFLGWCVLGSFQGVSRCSLGGVFSWTPDCDYFSYRYD